MVSLSTEESNEDGGNRMNTSDSQSKYIWTGVHGRCDEGLL